MVQQTSNIKDFWVCYAVNFMTGLKNVQDCLPSGCCIICKVNEVQQRAHHKTYIVLKQFCREEDNTLNQIIAINTA